MPQPDSSKVACLYLLRIARGKAKKDVGHGGLDEWFSGHDGAKGKGEGAQWGDWVSISPVERELKKPDGKTKKIKPGDIVGPCGISNKPEWKGFTNDGKDPLKCMPRQKAYDMPKKERADVARGKMQAEKRDKGEGKKPTRTRTFKDKKAKTTGTKIGDGESVGLFIPLPKNLAAKFPSLGENDDSPSHVTFLYIGDFRERAQQQKLVEVLKDCCRRWWPLCEARLGKLGYFDHPDKNRRVAHVSVEFDKDLAGFKHRVKQELSDAGITVGDKFPEYNPHVTLAYLPGMDSKWGGPVPQGSWRFDEMEVWGLPEVHKVKLGPSAHKISSDWLDRRVHRRVVARHLVRKVAGWWAVTKGSPGINSFPVDKGSVVNMVPETDPGTGFYNGDEPADIMGAALEDVNRVYLEAWGRPASPTEVQAVFDFVFGGFQSHPENYFPKDMLP